jgi:hypothetical protein
VRLTHRGQARWDAKRASCAVSAPQIFVSSSPHQRSSYTPEDIVNMANGSWCRWFRRVAIRLHSFAVWLRWDTPSTRARPLALYIVKIITTDFLVIMVVIATDAVYGRTGGRVYSGTDGERPGRSSEKGRMRTIAVGWRVAARESTVSCERTSAGRREEIQGM